MSAVDGRAVRAELAQLLKARAQRDMRYPLAPAQLAMWFHQQAETASTAYNMPFAFWMRGEGPSAVVLQKCLDMIVRRHSALRTVFSLENEEVTQCVRPAVTVSMRARVIDRREWEVTIEQLTRDLAAAPFDLQRGPLFRFEFVKVDVDLHVLLATFHHIVMDGWSIGLFLKDFALIYTALTRTNSPPELEPLSMSYGDYARERASAAQGDSFQRHIDHWRSRLADLPEALALPLDFVRPSLQSFKGAVCSVHIPLRQQQQLVAVATAADATFFMLALTAYCILLSRLSGQFDMVLGVASANRSDARQRSLLGLFTDILPMRVRLDPRQSFTEALRAVRAVCLTDYEHAEVSLSQILEAIRHERDPRRSNLFQAGLDFQNAPWPREVGDAIRVIHGDTGASKLDLNLNLSTDPRGLHALFEYNTALFSAQTVSGFGRCFERLLLDIAARPETTVARLALMNEEERAAVLAASRGPSQELPVDARVLSLIDQRAATEPEHIAVESECRLCSYGELRTRFTRLAQRLEGVAGGVGGSAVGIFCERSIEMIVAMLAIWRAGGAYVPLPIDAPAERLEYLVKDAGIEVVVCTPRSRERWPQHIGVRHLQESADVAESVLPDLGSERGAGVAPDGELAYIMYTSGTTGEPKGVMISHRAVANFVLPSLERLTLTPADRVLQFAQIGFDACVEEIFPCLVAGSTLVMREGDWQMSVAAFIAWCNSRHISVLDLPTAFWHEIVDTLMAEPGTAFGPELRLVIIGGEAALAQRVLSWQEHVAPTVKLLNTYGPTEATVCVSSADLGECRPSMTRSSGVSLGRPHANAVLYVLDELGEPVPPNVFGELVIGGPIVADGYIGRATLTAERFVPDHLGGTRYPLYKTGDQGRCHPDGSFEFRGRRDAQVKIRGFRVELEEIEAVLATHASVQKAVVEARRDVGGAVTGLVGFVGAAGEAAPTAAALRRWLAERVPAYMVPAVIQIVASFPLTENGKLDRVRLMRELPAAQLDTGHFGRQASPTEQIIIGIWESLLDVRGIGVEDNFFELGGHSLLMIRMLSRLRQAFDVEVAFAQVFETPTASALAAAVDLRRSAGGEAGAPVPVPHAAGPGPFPQTFAQQRLWFHEQTNPGSNAYLVPLRLSITGELDVVRLQASLDALIRRHAILRTRFADLNGEPVQYVEAERTVALQVDTLQSDSDGSDRASREAAVSGLLAAQLARPFDLTRDALLRAGVIRLAPDACDLWFVLHHIIVDDWSIQIFLSDLCQAYSQGGVLSPASVAPFQYADYALWQQRQLTNRSAHVDFWREELRGSAQLLPLPLKQLRPAQQSFVGARHCWSLPRELGPGLRLLARRMNVTLHMVLLAAWSVLLARLSGQNDVVVGVPVSNRNLHEFERVMGFFVNTIPLRIRLDWSATATAMIAGVRRTSLAAYAHQDVPLELIVGAAAPVRSLAFNPLFVTLFDLKEGAGRGFKLGELSVEEGGFDYATAKMDISLGITVLGEIFEAEIEYARDLFAAETIREWASHLERILQAFALGGTQTLREIAAPVPVSDASQVPIGPSEPSSASALQTVPLAPPVSALERLIHAVWREHLPQPLGVDHDFFALGGNSLMALRSLTKLKRILQMELSIRTFIAGPSIRRFAANIEAAATDREEVEEIAATYLEISEPSHTTLVNPTAEESPC